MGYLQHGRRHGIKGSDPIWPPPQRWALYGGATVALATTAIQYVAMTELTTNDPGLYDYGSGVSGHQVPQVNETGIYKVTYTALITSATAGDRIQLYYSGDIGVSSHYIHGYDTIVFGTGGAGDSTDRTISFTTLRAIGGGLSVPDTVPQGENPTVQNLTASRTFTADIRCLIEKIGEDDYTTDGHLTW